MKINSIKIRNFRNIVNAEYDLSGKLNIFVGPNKMGKTNRLLAVYWAISDYLFDGSSNYQSFKVIGKEKEKVSVEIVFDSFKLKKEYSEKWVKTRGSDEVIMTGHETDFYIDDIKYSVTEAKKILLEKIGLSGFDFGKFDLLRSLMDPLYISKCDWRVLRNFIIDLIGDVSNDDVLMKEKNLLNHLELFKSYDYDTSKISKFLKQQISICKSDSSNLESKIEGLKEISDVNESELDEAVKNSLSIKEEISKLKNPTFDVVKNPIISKLEKELAIAESEYLDFRKKDEKHSQEVNSKIYDELALAEKNKSEIIKEIDEIRRNKNNIQDEHDQYNRDVYGLEGKIQMLEDNLNVLRVKYVKENSGEFEINDASPVSTSCPECGFILNQEALELAEKELNNKKKLFEENKKNILDELVNSANLAKVEVENCRFKNNDLKDKIQQTKQHILSYGKDVENKETDLKQINSKIEGLKSKILKNYCSEETHIAQVKSKTIERELIKEKSVQIPASTDVYLLKLEDQLSKYDELIKQHAAFGLVQKQIEKIEHEKISNSNKLCSLEEQQIANELFIMTKLNIFKSNISNVFGNRIKFTLIESNIKEGSWNEVCYPSVLDKTTPFENGSGSEQIVAGIYISECIKRKLGIEDIPFIFDECDKLDSQSLSQLETEAQIITTKVDDVNYKEVTLI